MFLRAQRLDDDAGEVEGTVFVVDDVFERQGRSAPVGVFTVVDAVDERAPPQNT